MTQITVRLSGAVLLAALGCAYGAVRIQGQAPAVSESSFKCIKDGTKVRNTYIRHPDPAKQKEAVRIFTNNLQSTEYPAGTIVQLIPAEAMVKHAKAEFPNTNGWEFFALDVSATGTKITARGDKATNRGGTCVGCHQPAAKFDWVCERTHGCAAVPLTDDLIAKLQASDASCK
jgi:hypothetical protein